MATREDVRVLHVDDDPEFAESTAEIIEREDDQVTVTIATSAREGLNHLADHEFDCIISEYDMPGISGIEFLERVREEYGTLPFILLTGEGSEAVAGDALRKGATDYLQKSGRIEADQLPSRIRTVVDRYESERSRRQWKRAVETAAQGIAIVSETGEFLRVNQAYADAYEESSEALVGTNWRQWYKDEEVSRYEEEILPTLREEGVWEGEAVGRRTDGTRFAQQLSLSTLDGGGHVCFMEDITDRKERERKLERRYQAIFNHTYQFTGLMEPDGTLIEANETALEFGGLDHEDVIGKPVWETYWWQIDDETQEELREAVSRAANGEFVRYDVEVRGVDENLIIDFSIRPITDEDDEVVYLIPEGRDITNLKALQKRERELEQAERRFDAVFNAPSALVTLLDTDGYIEEISDAAVELVPESRGAIRGRPLWEGPWFDGDSDLQDRLRDAVKRALDGESARIETSVPVPDRELVIDTMFEPITDDTGELRGVLGIARDITERHRDQRIRRQLLSSSREMMGARSREQLAEIVSRTASSVLGHNLNAVYLHDSDGADSEEGSLSPAAWTDRIRDLFGDPPKPTGVGPVSEAYRTGDPAIYDTLQEATDRATDRYDPVKSLLALPLGEHGVLAMGATETGAFADADVDLYRLLTVSAATAFDRLERTLDLQRYETLFETVQDRVYVLDEDGHIELVSDALAEAVGYDSDDLVGEHVSAVVTDETTREVESLILDLLVTPEQVSSVCVGTLVAHDGTETPVEIELSILPYEESFRGSAGVVRDISERRQREEELRVFQRAITEAGIGLAMYGADGRFEYVNDHFADLVERSHESLEGSRVWETFDSLDPSGFNSYWETLAPGETEKRETETVRSDGSTVPVETVATAVEIEGDRHHILTAQDITDRRERRQQTQALHRIFRHNLRNDLTVLQGHTTLLAEELPEEFAPHIETVVKKSENLIDLTETATEARTVLNHDTSREPVDAVTLVAEQVSEVRSSETAAVEADLPEERYVWADSMLGIAIEHLLTNAVEHNDSPSPKVGVRVSSAPDREDWIVIEVADNGPGVPDIERETLAEGRESQIQHSVGLGLWIVRWIVSRYGGDLSFHDRNPRGTRVQIALPGADDAVARQHTGETV